MDHDGQLVILQLISQLVKLIKSKCFLICLKPAAHCTILAMIFVFDCDMFVNGELLVLTMTLSLQQCSDSVKNLGHTLTALTVHT